MYKSKKESHKELLNRARLPTLYNRRLQDTATWIYNVKNNLAYHDYSKLGTLNSVSETVALKYLVLKLHVMENIQDNRVHISRQTLARN